MKKGEKAIPFKWTDIYGNAVSLENYRGKRVLLSFLRTAACPFCNLRVHYMIHQYDAWKAQGLEIIAVFASSADEILQHAGKQKPPFPVIGDPDEVLYQQYGIGHSIAGMFKAMKRIKTLIEIMKKGFFSLKSLRDQPVLTGDFLIDRQGVIQEAYYGKDFGDHLPFERIDAWLKEETLLDVK